MKHILLICLIMLTFSQLIYADMVRDSLIANWSFDRSTVIGETIKDLTGNYDAKMIGKPNIIAGKYGEAIEFNGKDNYLSLTTLKGFGSHLNNFSIDFWIKTVSTQDWTTLFKTLTDGLSMAWAIDLNRTAKPAWAYSKGTTHFYIRDKNGKAFAAEIKADIYDNSWHHIAWVVKDASSNNCLIYVDGKPKEIEYTYTDTPLEYVDFQYPVYLGSANNRGNVERFSPSAVDEFRIYTKALTENEVLNNMISASPVFNLGKLASKWGRIKNRGFGYEY